MCLPVLTDIPEVLTFTPFWLSLGCGEGLTGARGVGHARFLCFIDCVGDCLCGIDCACDHANEYSEAL